MKDRIKNIAILGTGIIGASWAAFYAGKGFSVKLYDADKSKCDAGYKKAVEFLNFLSEHSAISGETCEKAIGSLHCSESLDDLVGDAELVQESVVERYDVKNKVLGELERFASGKCIFASSSSGLLVSEMQKDMKHPERVLIAHPFNPPHLIPLVELVPGNKTSPDLVKTMSDFYQKLGKTPVTLKKEVPGHIANRLQAAIWREAIQLVIDGVASVEDIDKALCAGPGLRWALMGQHMVFHLGGGIEGGIGYFVDHIGISFEKLWKDMAKWDCLPAETKEQLVAGVTEQMHGRELKEIAAWRDEKLIEISKVIGS
ncbi:3-hydroxyacyl-CoA dehydrogenase NAD-binding domain-containing protein [Thermodesulfobacteriota bacterium]